MESESALILPEQFFAASRSDSSICGERALRRAVLADGLRCVAAPPHNWHAESDRLGAEAWIRAVDEASPLSLVHGCETLGVDPDALRDALFARQTKGLTTSG